MSANLDETKIKFGDKIFAYGLMTDYDRMLELGLENPSYNSVMGYKPTGGYLIVPQQTNMPDECLPGFVTDPSLASGTLFSKMNLVDVTDLLSRREPSPAGTKVWMPILQDPTYL